MAQEVHTVDNCREECILPLLIHFQRDKSVFQLTNIKAGTRSAIMCQRESNTEANFWFPVQLLSFFCEYSFCGFIVVLFS